MTVHEQALEMCTYLVYLLNTGLCISFVSGYFLQTMPWAPWIMALEKCYGLHSEFPGEHPERLSFRTSQPQKSMGPMGPRAPNKIRSGCSPGKSPWNPWHDSTAILHGAHSVFQSTYIQDHQIGDPDFVGVAGCIFRNWSQILLLGLKL